jgi:hypothetical protein
VEGGGEQRAAKNEKKDMKLMNVMDSQKIVKFDLNIKTP